MEIQKPEILKKSYSDPLFLAISLNNWEVAAQLLWNKIEKNEKIDPNQIINKSSLFSLALQNFVWDGHKEHSAWILDTLCQQETPIDLWAGNPRAAHVFIRKNLSYYKDYSWVQHIHRKLFENPENLKNLDTLKFEMSFHHKKDDEKFNIGQFFTHDYNASKLEWLKTIGYDFLKRDEKGRSLICFCKSESVFEFLKQFNYPFDEIDQDGKTPLIYLMSEDKSSDFKKAVATHVRKKPPLINPENVNLIKDEKFKALIILLQSQNSKYKVLNGKKALEFQSITKNFFQNEINYTNSDGNSILALSIISKQWKVVSDLGKFSPDWFLKNKQGISPFVLYLYHQNIDKDDFKQRNLKSLIEENGWGKAYWNNWEKIDDEILNFFNERLVANTLGDSFYYKIITNLNGINGKYSQNIKDIYAIRIEKTMKSILNTSLEQLNTDLTNDNEKSKKTRASNIQSNLRFINETLTSESWKIFQTKAPKDLEKTIIECVICLNLIYDDVKTNETDNRNFEIKLAFNQLFKKYFSSQENNLDEIVKEKLFNSKNQTFIKQLSEENQSIIESLIFKRENKNSIKIKKL